MSKLRFLWNGLPLFFMVLAMVFGVALMAHGGWRMIQGLPVVCDR